ncbi:MAG: UDP-glucose/GDP-mannose dehydrogenase family protein [Acidobacteria bacterium]|nr:UDP-glucose/GDP-mannose dehydrogenase family protein [Acidobacteriota bacterium]TDI55551.1 MAG: UDP-glucose/GDP-mannose dehydrogenase family protein [Acidobacteriota bacterium]
MQVAIIGAGYVGLVTGGGLASLGHRVRLGEADPDRVARLESGDVPIFEKGLPDLLSRGSERELISYHTSNIEAVVGAELVFLCLPTPAGDDGRADLGLINAVVDELANEVADDAIFVIKSTVPPGTVAGLRKRLADLGSSARVVSHPEFLREGKALDDFMKPDRIVVGAYDDEDAEAIAGLYESLDANVVRTDPTSAEMIKYASNSYLAARLTFVNTLANVCEAVGADVMDVISGMGMDHRIGPHFLQPGPGYGGSCFPKDTAALIGVAEDAGYDFELLRAVIEADREQRRRIAEKVRQAAGGGLRGRRVAMWGVTFKAGTDDVRESPALRIAELLEEDGADVVAYDPEGTTDQVTMVAGPVEATRDADVLFVATEWPEFLTVDMTEVAEAMKGYRVVDSRNLLDPTAVRAAGLDYWGLGRPSA